MKKLIWWIYFLSMLFLTWVASGDTTCCIVPVANLPPEGCSYGNPDQVKKIINGLPPGATIEIAEALLNFSNIVRLPGGSLGGEVENFLAMDVMQMTGTGVLANFRRNISMSVQCSTHIGPRNPGDSVQSFPTDFFTLHGQLPPGDPDFDLLRITAGTSFGMPSPGHTTLTKLPQGNWNVDSFFDITYRIDFVGAPGGALAGRSGNTTGTIRMMTGCVATAGGDDCYSVGRDVSQQEQEISLLNLNSTPIPANFFGPGSDPFDGVIQLGGGDPVGTDTIIRRNTGFSFPGGLPSTAPIVPIEFVSLNLVSCSPITITYGGHNPESWNVSVGLSPSLPSYGQMTATKTYANGGTFTSVLYVQPYLTFTKMGDPGTIRILDPGPWNLSTTDPHSWQDTSPKPNPPCEGNGFYPGIDSPVQMSSPSGDVILVLEPPHPTSLYTLYTKTVEPNDFKAPVPDINDRIDPCDPNITIAGQIWVGWSYTGAAGGPYRKDPCDPNYWVFEPNDPPTIAAGFDPNQSWLSDPNLLDHEQGHLDQEEIDIRKAQADIDKEVKDGTLKGRGKKPGEARKDFYDKVKKKIAKQEDEHQKKYDDDTKHGTDKQKQKEARDKQKKELSETNKDPAKNKGPNANSSSGHSCTFNAASGLLTFTDNLIVSVPDPLDPIIGAELIMPAFDLVGQTVDGEFWFTAEFGSSTAEIQKGGQTFLKMQMNYITYSPAENMFYGLGMGFWSVMPEGISAYVDGVCQALMSRNTLTLYGVEIYPDSNFMSLTSGFTVSADSPFWNNSGMRIVGTGLEADLNVDYRVDIRDFAILANQWLQVTGYPSADINPSGGDGAVNISDLILFADQWLEGTAP